jgi:transcriptional regulator with XRE-family HTH domain
MRRYPFKRQRLIDMGRRLRVIRESRKISQTELARRIFKSKQVVSAYELGRAEMLATSLAAIASALSCDLNWIVRGWDIGDLH